ncbi:MAG: hypothetical protein LBL83_10280 [Clostridiales bacterium]|jgi:hypothetical protein|nr:hypothetical protein [Clostridiales bacterium]
MAIIYQHDKRSNITYAYESHSYWDKEKKMTRAKRTLIGRVDKETGEIAPTDGRCRKDKAKKELAIDLDYKAMYERLERRLLARESPITALRKEIAALKGQG